MTEVKSSKEDIDFAVKGFLYKRFNHFLDLFEEVSDEIYNEVLKTENAPKLDDIKKKRIRYPDILFPGLNIPLEWWYFTGHLDSGKRKFGFEFCFFKMHPQAIRMGFLPMSVIKKEPFLVNHMTITDKIKKTFTRFQESGVINPEKISYDKLDLFLNGISLKFSKEFKIKSDVLNLTLKPVKKLVKHFDQGYESVYDKPKHNTYYVTFPRLNTTGVLKLKGKRYNVSGVSWFDHQKCNLPHKSPVIGWDWFSVIFDDNTELMFFRLRDKKGLNIKHLGGSFIDEKGNLTKLNQKDVIVSDISKWKSPETGNTYPSGWKMSIRRLGIKLKIIPCVKNQEVDSILTTFTSYWEGACDVFGEKNGKKISGQSYIELVGYDKRLLKEIVWKSVQ